MELLQSCTKPSTCPSSHISRREVSVVKYPSGDCHWTSLMMSKCSPSYLLPYGVILIMDRHHFVHAPCQWEMTLQSNIVSHWLGAYTKWSQISFNTIWEYVICKILTILSAHIHVKTLNNHLPWVNLLDKFWGSLVNVCTTRALRTALPLVVDFCVCWRCHGS